MCELFEKSLPAALLAGISIFDYWDMTWGEIQLSLQAHRKKMILKQKQQAIMDHAYIGMLGRMLDGKKVGLYESYPLLFKEESRQAQINQAKQRMINFAAAHSGKGAQK